MGRRQEWGLLAAIGAVGAANGFFLGLTIFTLLKFATQIGERAPPPPEAATICGAALGLSVLAIAMLRERSLAEREVPSWAFDPPRSALEHDWETVVAELARTARLTATPRLCFVEGEVPNAFTLGDANGEGASIMVTAAALERVTPREMLAVLAHQVAHIEAGDLRAVALADSIQATVADLGGLKGRYLWGPWLIVRRSPPVLACMGGMALVVWVGSQPALKGPTGFVAFVAAVLVYTGWEEWGWDEPIKRFAKRSWMTLFQFALWLNLFGLLTLVEALLAWPTVFALSRLLSRSRVYAADRRAVELTGDPVGLRDALEALTPVEHEPGGARFDRLRFSLFATPRAPSGYRAWVERATGSHPSAARRIARLDHAVRKPALTCPTAQVIPIDHWNNRGR